MFKHFLAMHKTFLICQAKVTSRFTLLKDHFTLQVQIDQLKTVPYCAGRHQLDISAFETKETRNVRKNSPCPTI